MRKRLLGSLVAVMMAAVPMSASAYGIFWPGDYCTTTTTAGGIAAAVYFLTKKPATKENVEVKETNKAAQLYLKQSHLQLAQDLAEQHGPVLDDLAAGTGIRAEHRDLFAARMSEHASELLELSNPETLDEAQTQKFMDRLVSIIKSDSTLAADFDAA